MMAAADEGESGRGKDSIRRAVQPGTAFGSSRQGRTTRACWSWFVGAPAGRCPMTGQTASVHQAPRGIHHRASIHHRACRSRAANASRPRPRRESGGSAGDGAGTCSKTRASRQRPVRQPGCDRLAPAPWRLDPAPGPRAGRGFRRLPGPGSLEDATPARWAMPFR